VALLRKIIECFQGEGAHFDLSLANEFGLVGGGKSDFWCSICLNWRGCDSWR